MALWRPRALVEAAGPVSYEEESLVVGKPPIDKLSQKAFYWLVVLGRRFLEAERDFLAICGHAQSDQHLLACHVLRVDDQGHQV